jgi:hypothetical protein
MGPEYTTCVEPKDWTDLDKTYLVVLGVAVGVGGLLAVFTGGSSLLISGLAFLEALRYVLNWLLHVKLICLHRFHSDSDCICGGPSATTVCAIGEIMTTEIVGEGKNAVEKVDDDFAINLALFPFDLNEFAQRGFVDWTLDIHDKHSDAFSTYKNGLIDIATKPGQPQGDLLTRQPVPYGIPKEFGYLTTMVMQKGGDYFPYSNVIGRSPGSDDKKLWADYERDNHASKSPVRFSVPVLHCEFEGSRTRDLLAALEGFPLGSSFCKKNWFTKLICKIVAAVLLPIVLADLALAWLRNTEGSTAPALVGGGTIGPKSRVIVRGSWRFDSGHSGWNEIHAVRIVQSVEAVPSDPAEFKLFLHLWCEVFAQTPTSDGVPRVGGGVYKPQDVPAAEVTLIAQGQPENQWEFHPLVDGCQPPIKQSDPPPLH